MRQINSRSHVGLIGDRESDSRQYVDVNYRAHAHLVVDIGVSCCAESEPHDARARWRVSLLKSPLTP